MIPLSLCTDFLEGQLCLHVCIHSALKHFLWESICRAVCHFVLQALCRLWNGHLACSFVWEKQFSLSCIHGWHSAKGVTQENHIISICLFRNGWGIRLDFSSNWIFLIHICPKVDILYCLCGSVRELTGTASLKWISPTSMCWVYNMY